MHVFVVWLIIVIVGVGSAYAHEIPNECTEAGQDHVNTDKRKNYKVNANSFDEFVYGVDAQESRIASSMGADVWNETAHAGTFGQVAIGTSREDIPLDYDDCTSKDIDYSLVVAQEQGDVMGGARGRCCKEQDGTFWEECTQFLIFVNGEDGDGNARDWGVGRPADDQFDLVSTLSHEFGHTLNLGHPDYHEDCPENICQQPSDVCAYGVMTPSCVMGSGNTERRDLYQWDIECAREVGGERNMTAYYRLFDPTDSDRFTEPLSGQVYQERVRNISAGQAWDLESDELIVDGMHQVLTEGYVEWMDFYSNNLLWLDEWPMAAGVGPNSLFRKEMSSVDVIGAFSGYEEVPEYEQGAQFPMFEYSYQLGGKEYFRYCSHEVDSYSCDADDLIQGYSGKRLSAAWDPATDRTVNAWAHQNRENDSRSRKVKLSVGMMTAGEFPTPDKTGINTDIPPEVVCLDAEGYNCVLGYTREEDSMNYIRVQRFRVVEGENRHEIEMEGEEHKVSVQGAVQTASKIALWHAYGEVWLAYRKAWGEQNINFWSTEDLGKTWEQETGYARSDVGPAVANYKELSEIEGENIMVYGRVGW